MNRVFAVMVAAALASGCGYNRIQTLDEQVNGYQAQIEVQLQRRADLVPNLVETVKGFARQELAVFEEVTSARAALGGAIEGGSIAEMAAANQTLSGALGRLIAIAEDNPEIQSNENFRMLQDQLEGTENRIATARGDYNTAVREYNAYIRRFPQVLTAKAIGAGAREYFEAEEEAREVPRVEF
ncbi:MAG: LemA family protein [Gemmatimonadota bacterium]|nr:MAG: LemA family protein [Gemmatimonadota bacterium]